MKTNQLVMNAVVLKFVAVMYLAAISPCHSGLVFDSSEIQSEASILRLYARWISHFNVTRVESDPQQPERLEAFKRTALSIHGSPAASLNSLADTTAAEYKRLASCVADHPLPAESDHSPVVLLESATVPPPRTVDWRVEGAVLPVLDQRSCGACWAFSAADTIASIRCINSFTKDLDQLSVQQLVDCVEKSCGCKHGSVRSAFDFVIKNKGITTEENYPYQMKTGECRKKDPFYPMVQIDGYQVVPWNDEVALRQAVERQPVSATIDANTEEFKNYVGGIFSGPCECDEKKHSHQVTIVGYGIDHWIIKNSWGTGWGNKGYMMLAFEKCGIARNAVYPIKKWALQPY